MTVAISAKKSSAPIQRLEAYVFDNARLLTKDGEIDEAFLRRTAKERAFFKYGVDATKLDIAFQLERCRAIAQTMRDQYRRAHGLTEDPPVYVTPYGKDVAGVRRSAF